MLYKNQKNIQGVGILTYEVVKNIKYGVKIEGSLKNSKTLNDVFKTYEDALSFLKITEENEVTPDSLEYIFEDYMYEKYLQIIKKIGDQ